MDSPLAAREAVPSKPDLRSAKTVRTLSTAMSVTLLPGSHFLFWAVLGLCFTVLSLAQSADCVTQTGWLQCAAAAADAGGIQVPSILYEHDGAAGTDRSRAAALRSQQGVSHHQDGQHAVCRRRHPIFDHTTLGRLETAV